MPPREARCCQAAQLCLSAGRQLSALAGSRTREGAEEEGSRSFCCSVAPSFAPLPVVALRVLVFAAVLQVIADLLGLGPRGSHVLSCGTGDDSFIDTVLALASFFPGVELR